MAQLLIVDDAPADLRFLEDPIRQTAHSVVSASNALAVESAVRPAERRAGRECRSRWAPCH